MATATTASITRVDTTRWARGRRFSARARPAPSSGSSTGRGTRLFIGSPRGLVLVGRRFASAFGAPGSSASAWPRSTSGASCGLGVGSGHPLALLVADALPDLVGMALDVGVVGVGGEVGLGQPADGGVLDVVGDLVVAVQLEAAVRQRQQVRGDCRG